MIDQELPKFAEQRWRPTVATGLGQRLQFLDDLVGLDLGVFAKGQRDRIGTGCDGVGVDDSRRFAGSFVCSAIGLQRAANVELQFPSLAVVGVDTIHSDGTDLTQFRFDKHVQLCFFASPPADQCRADRWQR